MKRSRLVWIGLVAVSIALGTPATSGQLSRTQLLGFLSDTPLHGRLAASDAAVIGTIDAVGVGRIQVRDAVVLFGSADERFELKRSPSNPPAVMVGERVLLLLRGARSPYLLVDRNEDLVKIDVDEMEARWSLAIRNLRDALTPPLNLASDSLAWVYLKWLDLPADDLQRAAIVGFADRDAPFHPLAANFVEALIDTAASPQTEFGLRRAAAFVAGRSSTDQPDLATQNPEISRRLARLDQELRD